MSKSAFTKLEIKRLESQRLYPVEKTGKYSASEYWRYINREEE